MNATAKTLAEQTGIGAMCQAVNAVEAASEARRTAWLTERMASIVGAYKSAGADDAIALLREACQQWGNLE